MIGFALEDKDLKASAEKKFFMIIANTPAAIAADKTTVHIKTVGDKWIKIAQAAKTTVARKIIQLI